MASKSFEDASSFQKYKYDDTSKDDEEKLLETYNELLREHLKFKKPQKK